MSYLIAPFVPNYSYAFSSGTKFPPSITKIKANNFELCLPSVLQILQIEERENYSLVRLHFVNNKIEGTFLSVMCAFWSSSFCIY